MIRNIYILLLLSTFLYSATINVPDDYPTIQEGIDASQDGHTVLVANGDNNLLPKNKTFDFNQYCSRSISENNKQLNPNLFFNSPAGKPIIHNNHDNQSRPDYTIEYLNTLSYSELIDLLVSIEWSDIDGLWDL